MRPATVGERFDAAAARDPGALALVDEQRTVVPFDGLLTLDSLRESSHFGRSAHVPPP